MSFLKDILRGALANVQTEKQDNLPSLGTPPFNPNAGGLPVTSNAQLPPLSAPPNYREKLKGALTQPASLPLLETANPYAILKGALDPVRQSDNLPSMVADNKPKLPVITPSPLPTLDTPNSPIGGAELLSSKPLESTPPSMADASRTFTPDAIQQPTQTANPYPQLKGVLSNAVDAGNENAASLLPSLSTQQQINNIQSKNYSKAKYDKNGKLIQSAGADRDSDWSFGEKLAGVGLGVAEGLLSGRGLLGGAVQGIQNATDRNFLEKREDRQNLGRLLPRLEQEREAEKLNLETQGKILANRKTIGEIGRQDIDTINARVKPLIDVFMSDKQVDEKEANILSELTGLPYSATQWQSYIDKEVNGKTFSRSEYDPRYAENTTLPTDPTEVPRNIQIGKGNPLPLTPKQAAPIIAANEQGNANRTDAAYRFEQTEKRLAEQFGQSQALEIMKYNFDQFGKYQGDAKKFASDKLAAERAVAENAPLVNSYTQQISQDEAFLRGVSGLSTKEKVMRESEIKTAQDRLTANKKQLAEVQGKIDGANYFINNAVAPTAPSQLTAPKGSNAKTASRTQVLKYAKNKGISFEEAKKHAEADGYTVK